MTLVEQLRRHAHNLRKYSGEPITGSLHMEAYTAAADRIESLEVREKKIRDLHKPIPEWGEGNEGSPTAFCVVCCNGGCSYPEHLHNGQGKPSCPTIAILDGSETSG